MGSVVVAHRSRCPEACTIFLDQGSNWCPLHCKADSKPLVAQMVKNLPAMGEIWVQSLGREDILEKEMATHSSIPAWRIPWTEEPAGSMMGETLLKYHQAHCRGPHPAKWKISLWIFHLLIQVFSGKEENLTKRYNSVVNIFIAF